MPKIRGTIGDGNRDHATSSKRGLLNAFFSNLSKFGLDNYVVMRSERPLLEEVAKSLLLLLMLKVVGKYERS